MKSRTVVVSPRAQRDLGSIYLHVSEAASPFVADEYVRRIEALLAGLEIGAERGTLRNDIRAGLRIVGFERRLTVLFSVDECEVTVLRIFRKGADWERSAGRGPAR